MRRKPLFPGHNVYHQLDLITDLLGKPLDEEIEKVRSEKARDYLNSLQFKPPRDLTPLFPVRPRPRPFPSSLAGGTERVGCALRALIRWRSICWGGC